MLAELNINLSKYNISAEIGVSSKMYHGSKDKNPIVFICIISFCKPPLFLKDFGLEFLRDLSNSRETD